MIIHTKCFKTSEFESVNSQFYCLTCAGKVVRRYNPYKLIEASKDIDNDYDMDYDYDEVSKISNILENCTNYSPEDFNKLISCKSNNII